MLEQNYPNPFNPVTNIKFHLRDASFVKLIVFDIQGREVETLVNEKLEAGVYTSGWNASDMPSGVYLYKIETATFSEVKKMILLK